MSNSTARSFSDKWHRNRDAFYEETLREGSDTQNWILSRNGFAGPNELRTFLSEKQRVLDAGCGNGRVTALLRRYSSPSTTEIVGIDLVAADVARDNLAAERSMRFVQKDLLGDLADLGSFDFIYCQEVLHHTPDPRRAFMNLCNLLSPSGEIAIYVYKQKAPVREYVDDFVRNQISHLPYDEALKHCKAITEFGAALSAAGVEVTVPAVPILGIEAGRYDMQRLVYHFFMKCYWNPSVTHDENVAVNYDWYHPQTATRHTLAEVEEWFGAAQLEIFHRFTDFYGITVRGRKLSSQ